MDWTAVRDRFPTLERATYLNSCSKGAPSQSSLAALQSYVEQWTNLGASAWYELWMEEIADWRANVARLIGAKPSEIAWTPSVSAALGTLAGALDRQTRSGTGRWAHRSDIVLADLEFPTAVAAFQPRPGTRLAWARSPDRVQVPAASYAAEMGATTQAVVASRVFYTTGALQPVSAIAAAARKAGVLPIVDDYQATGQVALDVREQQLDVVVGGSLKWLCGGVACGWMFVREPLIRELEPTHAGWWANSAMFDFQIEQFKFGNDARRFEGGELGLPSLFTSNAAVQLQLELGPKRIEARVQELTRDLVERFTDAGHALRIHPDPKLRTGIVMVPRKDAKADVARLAKEGIIVDDRPGCVRISPHFYNTTEENQTILDALAP